ncbi:MAG: hypothetical protein AB7D28_01340 [Candidatus Berkiella sp.]
MLFMKKGQQQTFRLGGIWKRGIERLKRMILGLNKNELPIQGRSDVLRVKAMADTDDTLTYMREWFSAVDSLQSLVLTLKQNYDSTNTKNINLDLLTIHTYLYHIDRLLVTIREQLYSYQYRVNEFTELKRSLNEVSFLQAKKSAQQCYITILGITQILKSTKIEKLKKHQSFIGSVHNLELDASALISAIRSLNQYSCQQETIRQLENLEKSLMDSFVNSKSQSQLEMLHYSEQLGLEVVIGSKGSLYKDQSNSIKDVNHKAFILKLISIFEALKRCYVVARKSTINDALDGMSQNLEKLISIFSQETITESEVMEQLQDFYNAIESIRFSTNRDSRCSQNLFEKAKAARHEMREVCAHNEYGLIFLKMISLKRIDCLKYKIK